MTLLALGRGLAGVVRPRLLAVHYLLLVLLALAVAVPFQRTLHERAGVLPDASEKASRLDPSWYDDFRRSAAPGLGALATTAGLVTWLHVFASACLAGGVIGAFDRRAAARRREEGRSYGFRVFFADAVRWALPMLRFVLVALPLFYLLDLAFNDGLGHVVRRYLEDREGERLGVVADWLRQGLLLLLVWAVATWLDHARAAFVVGRRRSVLLTLGASAASILRRPGPVVAVSAAFLAAELAVMGIASRARGAAQVEDARSLWTWVAATQVLVLLRLGLGFGRMAGYVALAEEERDEREARMGLA